jgi:alkanesulfonate monooxygenase SsuD/methylene tetrahydromethanopterin reductase-like flavin-dependent oxidoreductase (luciferase family)
MKCMWFHLMPYMELPDDFRQKHPSVWVDIHSELFDPQRAHHMYNDFLDELEFAADCGYDAICCNEHHSNGYGLMPSPNLIASALARRTTDTAICVMGNSLALYNPPTRVAEEFAMTKFNDPLAAGTTGSTAGTRFAMVAREMADIVDRGYVIVGSPNDVVEQLREVAVNLNVGHLMLLLQYGNMSKELTKYNTKLFAEQVMPKLRPMFSEWEDKWWPKPMDKGSRATVPVFAPGVQAAE